MSSGCSSPRSTLNSDGSVPIPEGTGGKNAGGATGGSGAVAEGSKGGGGDTNARGGAGAGGAAPVDAPGPSDTGGNQGASGQGGSDAGKAAPIDGGCPEGFHRCGANCVDVRSVNSCGTTCNPCPISPNGQAFCDGSKCGLACTAGFHLCSNACMSDNDPASCGTSCAPCSSAPANGVATCVDGRQCGFRCDQGFFKCGAECKTTEATVCGNRSIVKMAWAQAPAPPPGRKLSCSAGPDTFDEGDCSVVRWGNYSYWSLSDVDNSITTFIAAYDKNGAFIKEITKPGARYTWKVTFDDTGLTFHGQASHEVKASWTELRIDQPAVND
jgi:hypothetical protein